MEVTLTNITSKRLVAFVPSESWSIRSVGALENSGFTTTAMLSDQDFKTVGAVGSIKGQIVLRYVFSTWRVKDGLYPCRLVYDDRRANGQAASFGLKVRSQAGVVMSNKIFIRVKDSKIVGVRR